MPKFIRTFIAVKTDPRPDFLRMIKEIKKPLEKEKIKWVEDNNMHLTLKFLGDTTPVQVKRIKTELKDLCVNYSPFSFELKGLGFFKNKGYPRVLYIKTYNEEILGSLGNEIDTRMSDLGFEKESRPFSPHLTIARIKYLNNRPEFYKLTEKYENQIFQKVFINDIIFYQSILRSWGPEYKKLAAISLG